MPESQAQQGLYPFSIPPLPKLPFSQPTFENWASAIPFMAIFLPLFTAVKPANFLVTVCDGAERRKALLAVPFS